MVHYIYYSAIFQYNHYPLGLGLDHATVRLSAGQRGFLELVGDPHETVQVLLDE